MPDITMCESKGCKKKDTCFRHNAKPDKLQSYRNYEIDCIKENYKYYWKDEREYIGD